jgi:hypothetical protein
VSTIVGIFVGIFVLNNIEAPVVVYPFVRPGISIILLARAVSGRCMLEAKNPDKLMTGGCGCAIGCGTIDCVNIVGRVGFAITGVVITGATEIVAATVVIGAAEFPDISDKVRARACSITFCISARDERSKEIEESLILPPFNIIA